MIQLTFVSILSFAIGSQKITERKWKSRAALRSGTEKKKKPKLKKLERAHEKRGAGLERVGYDPKSVEKFGGLYNSFYF